jgi:purine-nucleoside phosphorylase
MDGKNEHILSVENLKKVTATGIVSVDNFSPTQLILSFTGGRIVVSGSGMKIVSFSQSTGAFSADGNITGVRYIGKGGSIRQKIFK